MTWGVEDNVIERFAAAGVPEEKISFERDTYTFNFPGTPSELLAEFRTYYGPTMNAFDAAAANGREAELQAELDALFNEQNTSPTEDATSIPATFLRVTVAVLDAAATRRVRSVAQTLPCAMCPAPVRSSTGHRHPMPCRRRQPTLGVDHLVDGKLLDVGRPLLFDFCRRHSLRDPHREGVEVLARLPEVDDSPATVDRPGWWKRSPGRWRAIGVDVIVTLVELLLGDPRELDADADSHPQPLFR